MNLQWYDRKGQPHSLEDPESMRLFDRLLGDYDYRVIAKEQIGGHEVSTVWLGIDHGFGMSPVPLIFETMVFPECDICERTPTEDAALATHDQIAAQVRDEERRR